MFSTVKVHKGYEAETSLISTVKTVKDGPIDI